jgi:hypothetical protein
MNTLKTRKIILFCISIFALTVGYVLYFTHTTASVKDPVTTEEEDLIEDTTPYNQLAEDFLLSQQITETLDTLDTEKPMEIRECLLNNYRSVDVVFGV